METDRHGSASPGKKKSSSGAETCDPPLLAKNGKEYQGPKPVMRFFKEVVGLNAVIRLSMKKSIRDPKTGDLLLQVKRKISLKHHQEPKPAIPRFR